MHFDVPVN